jgi:nucleoredoxin
MESIFGSTLVNKKSSIQTSSLNSVPLVLIFASASWCPPCRQFFPNLVSFYNTANHSSKRIEIIWLSLDRTPDDFNSIKKNIPWVAVPYETQQIERILGRYDIEIIPKLYLLNRDGSIAHTECRQDIITKGQEALNEWMQIRS